MNYKQLKMLEKEALFIMSNYSFRHIPGTILTADEMAKRIELTNVKPTATWEDIETLCSTAISKNMRGVCVNPYYVESAKKLLAGSGVLIFAVIDYPYGSSTQTARICKGCDALANGADGLDIVINQGLIKSGSYVLAEYELKDLASRLKTELKVIIEAPNLTYEEKIWACLLVRESGAAYIKTSTGTVQPGATIEDVALMKYIMKDKTKIKAAGFIKTFDEACDMIAYGADVIGASTDFI